MSGEPTLESSKTRQSGYVTVPSDGDTKLMLLDVGKEIMRLHPVSTLEDIENLRLIRNECRQYMTQMTDEIGQAQQLVWWQSVSGNQNWRVWLVYVPGWDEAIGFAMLRQPLPRRGSRWFVTLGLRTWMRGQGIGTLIYQALRELVPADEVWAIIREDNTPSIRAAEKAGYERREWAGSGVALVGRNGS